MEACRMTRIGCSKLYELIASGDIEVIKGGSMTLVPVDALSAFLEVRREYTGKTIQPAEAVG